MTSVLVVDDQISMRNMFKVMLDRAGYDVTTAVDGLDAYTIVTSTKKRFDLFVVDYHMPNMDGIEFTYKLKKLSDYKSTPLLIASTNDKGTKKQEAKEAGAIGWLTKPISENVLVTAVTKIAPP